MNTVISEIVRLFLEKHESLSEEERRMVLDFVHMQTHPIFTTRRIPADAAIL